jgi:hypothetical protein
MAHAGDVALDGFQRLQKAVQNHYKEMGDVASPGVACAWLGERGVWHISVYRCRDPYGESKDLISRAEHRDWIRCLMALIEDWLGKTGAPQSARVHLIDFMQKDGAWLAK